MRHTFTLLFLLTSFLSSSAFDQLPANNTSPHAASLDFVENNGQWHKEARFKALIGDGAFFLTDKGFVYNFIAPDTQEFAKDNLHLGGLARSHAYRANFIGATDNAVYQRQEQRSYYHNYYTSSDTSQWKGKVGVYNSITREQLYPGIDLIVYSKAGHFKYDLTVAAGADPSLIKLQYEGVQPALTKEGHLKILTTVNEIIEQAPYCYQLIKGREKQVRCDYAIQGDVLTFTFPDGYDFSLPLVIDPELIFSTYSGAFVPAGSISYYTPEAHATTYDKNGRLYAASAVHDVGWPVTMGAVQSIYNEGIPAFIVSSDVGINLYSADGSQLIYSTYLGGNRHDYPFSMMVNAQNELILAGGCSSLADFPLTPGCYDNTYAGGTAGGNINGMDIFITHFNGDGTALIGSTLLGGTGSEIVPSSNNMTQSQPHLLTGVVNHTAGCPLNLALDVQGNIWIISNTLSTDFPVTTNAQQPLYAGGDADMVLCKMNTTCTQLLYSSYLGGSGFDLGYDIKFNKEGNLVICGGTKSANFPTTAGSYKPTAPGGLFDGFVSIINPTNGAMLHATYLGTTDKDQAIILAVDHQNNIYVNGMSYGNYAVTPGTFSMPNGNIFIDKLSPDLSSSLASTCLGGIAPGFFPTKIYPQGFTFTDCGEVLFSGIMDHISIIPLPITANAITTDTSQLWICSLPSDLSTLSYASYFGTPHTPVISGSPYMSWSTGIHRFDPTGVLYQSVTAINQNFPTTSGAWATTSNLGLSQVVSGSPKDPVSFKIAFSTGANILAVLNTNDSGCAPYTVQFTNNTSGANTFSWDFGDGSPVSNLQTPPPHTYNNTGTYTVTLIASSDTGCVLADTVTFPITVVAITQPDITVTDTLLCQNSLSINISVQINNPNPSFSVQWSPGTGILSPSDQSTITVDPTQNTTYYVTVTDEYPGLCSLTNTDSVTITLAPPNFQLLTNDTTVCENTIFQLMATGNPNYTYQWIPATGLSNPAILNPILTVTQDVNYVLLASYPGCADTMVYVQVGMEPVPDVSLGPDKQACKGTPVALESLISPFQNNYNFQWTPATANLSSPTAPNTYFVADTNATYVLTVQTPAGCADSDTITVVVLPSVEGYVTPDTGYCTNKEIQLFASGGTGYSWSPAYGLSDTTIPNPIASPETGTSYKVIITNQYGCADTLGVHIDVYPNAVLTMPDSVNLYSGETYHVEPSTNCHYFTWFPPSGINDPQSSSPVFNPEVRTRYFVTAVTEHGCAIQDSIDILPKETVIDMPNAFAPSGYNSLFKPSKRGIAKLKTFDIYNRWGNKVYSSTDIDAGWDGTYNGVPQPIGVFVYVIEAETDGGKPFIKRGNVTLIR